MAYIREIFEFNSEGQMLAFEIRLNDVGRSAFKGITSAYSKGFEHPTLEKWAVEVERNDSEVWALLEADLNPNDINNITEMTSDWRNTETQ